MPGELPRRYTPNELAAIAASIAPHKIDARNIERLQKAVEAFQWASSVEDKDFLKHFPSSTNKGRRGQLKLIIELCERGAPESEIEIALSGDLDRRDKIVLGLDGRASELLGPVGKIDRLKLKAAAELALARIPRRGPDPKRARRQFIGDLAKIFLRITGKHPGRRVHDEEGGLFLAFAKAALRPFGAEQGCEADIKAALARLKRRKRPKVRKNERL
jgi:hypothetical protein